MHLCPKPSPSHRLLVVGRTEKEKEVLLENGTSLPPLAKRGIGVKVHHHHAHTGGGLDQGMATRGATLVGLTRALLRGGLVTEGGGLDPGVTVEIGTRGEGLVPEVHAGVGDLTLEALVGTKGPVPGVHIIADNHITETLIESDLDLVQEASLVPIPEALTDIGDQDLIPIPEAPRDMGNLGLHLIPRVTLVDDLAVQ